MGHGEALGQQVIGAVLLGVGYHRVHVVGRDELPLQQGCRRKRDGLAPTVAVEVEHDLRRVKQLIQVGRTQRLGIAARLGKIGTQLTTDQRHQVVSLVRHKLAKPIGNAIEHALGRTVHALRGKATTSNGLNLVSHARVVILGHDRRDHDVLNGAVRERNGRDDKVGALRRQALGLMRREDLGNAEAEATPQALHEQA